MERCVGDDVIGEIDQCRITDALTGWLNECYTSNMCDVRLTLVTTLLWWHIGDVIIAKVTCMCCILRLVRYGSVQKPRRRRKSAKDGEKRRKTAKYSELRCNYENLSKLVNNIYFSRKRPEVLVTGSCNCWMSSGVFRHFAVCCLLLAVFRPSFVVLN